MQQLYLHQSDNSFVYVCLFYVVMFQGPAQLSIACSMHMDGKPGSEATSVHGPLPFMFWILGRNFVGM